MVEKKSIPCTFLFSGYRLVNIQGGIFVWKKHCSNTLQCSIRTGGFSICFLSAFYLVFPPKFPDCGQACVGYGLDPFCGVHMALHDDIPDRFVGIT